MAIGVKTLTVEQNKQCRLVLLHDSDGKVLVLLPAAKLLNLVSLWREAGRNLQPTRCDDALRFSGKTNSPLLKVSRNYLACRC